MLQSVATLLSEQRGAQLVISSALVRVSQVTANPVEVLAHIRERAMVVVGLDGYEDVDIAGSCGSAGWADAVVRLGVPVVVDGSEVASLD